MGGFVIRILIYMDLIVESNSDLSDDCLEHDDNDWIIDKYLGKGNYGKVYRAKKINGKIGDNKVNVCAMKIIEKNDFDIVEINSLKKIKGMNLTPEYYGYGKDKDGKVYIYMDCIEHSISLSDALVLLPNKKIEQENDIIGLLHIISKKLCAIHDLKIIHRDLKSDHLLLFKNIDDDMDILFIDFGSSKLFCKDSNYISEKGTGKYKAPEVLGRNGKASRKSDVYSLGCIMLDMVGGDIIEGIPIIPDHLSSFLKNTIQSCILADYNARYDSSILYETLKLHRAEFNASWYKDILYAYQKEMELLEKREDDRSFNQPIEPGSIPDSLTSLKLQSFNHPITQGTIPNSIKYITLPSFNQPITSGSMPDDLIYLELKSFNQPIEPGSIPDSLTSLKLQSFNYPITSGSMPDGLIYLELQSFNQPIEPGSIPDSVIYLELQSFNQPITQGSIPVRVTSLKLKSFNLKITPQSIPNSVTKLKIPSFNHPIIPDSIPNCIKYITLPSFNHPITPGSIPDSVRLLELQSFNHPIAPGSISKSVKQLRLQSFNQKIENGSIDSVDFLQLQSFNQPIIPGSIPNVNYLFLESFNQTITPGSVSDSVTVLYLESFNIEFEKGCFPNSLTRLDLKSFNQPIKPESIPNSVTDLRIPSFNYPLISFPHLKKLSLGKFKQVLDYDNIPEVKHLSLGNEYNPVEDSDSSPNYTILILESDYHYNVPMNKKHLPPSVTNLVFKNYNTSFRRNSFPNTVTSLTLGNDFNEFSSLYNNIPTNIFNLNFKTQNFNNLNIDLIPNHITSLTINDKRLR